MSIDISNCPARQGFLPNDASGCYCVFANEKKGVIDINRATPYNTDFYKPNNCCTGFIKSRDPSQFPNGFPMNQRGRWNYNTTNTKLFRPNGLIVPNRLPNCPPGLSVPCPLVYSNSIRPTGVRQTGNLFPNTYRRSKKKLFAYLSRHRIYLNR